MCILCVIQKWSRRVATMLPWLVIPLIGLWALSQLLPPAFRFEITSPRLACVFVLLVTLFWYEILMPQLSAWRVRRNARLRERKRSEAIELQKLRKTATRRCRNCLTPYRDQNPGGGRFMCSYCGHISKRPVLDLPVPPGLGMSNSGIIKDLVGKGGKILNGKAWSDNGWICSQDWLENGNWVAGSIAGKSNYWRKNGSGYFGGDENCLAEKSYSGVVVFACQLLTSFFLSIRWIWRKIFRISSSKEDSSSDADHRGMLTKRGENGSNYHESKGEKARRKAEERRQARLEKELLEEEERKQREEVARLVEERRRLRDEKMEAEKDRTKSSQPTRDKDSKKEAEKRRQERRREKDKGSSKSNSDTEELEKKAGKESERKRDYEKKNEIDRHEHQKSGTDNVKGQSTESGHGLKHSFASNYSRGNAGTRRDIRPPERVAGNLSMNGDDKNVNRPVLSDTPARTTPKKSWQQLFTRTSSMTSSSNSNVISRPNLKPQAEIQSPQLHGQSSSLQPFDNPINFGLPSPFTLSTYPNVSSSTSLGFSSPIEPIFPRVVEGPHDFMPKEPELFEDPYIGLERPHALKNTSASPEANKPSPIESPLSRLRIADEKHNGSNWFSNTTKAQDSHTLPVDNVHVNEKGTWQMWNSSPLVQDGLGLVGGPGSWLLPPDRCRSNKEDVLPSSSQKTMASLFSKDDQVLSGTHSPQKVFLRNGQNGGAFSPVTCSSDNDPWLQNAFFPPLEGDSHFSLKPLEENARNEIIYWSPTDTATNHSFKLSPANCWSKKDWTVQSSGEGVGKQPVTRPNIGGLFPSPDVQSLWSFD
ncbi:hypothetical protein GH714_019107 [Hevea brasiliensis]|uniref:Uncharacterized protein n=1 Tax=Hevea brasiliensis TaxID=3981 RepID=A0A6A6M3J3_HEVBR|nr:hypothetical protein GH714_019107 [Hevea brasiliensis]